MTELIKLENVGYTYSKGTPFEKTALEGISLSINKGDFVGIIGHTGSGKSTLVQMLNGLMLPDTGKVYVDGADTTDKKTDKREIRRKIGLVFQYPEYQLFEENVRLDIAYAPLQQGLSMQEAMQRVHEAIAITGVSPDLLEKSPFMLSGGQKRRVAIAGVLAMKPQCLVLDEPTAGLDPRGRTEILHEIVEMQRKTGIACVLISHSMEEIASCTKYVYVLNKGKIHLQGTPAEVFAQAEALAQVKLTPPEITTLMQKVLGKTVVTLEEAEALIKQKIGAVK